MRAELVEASPTSMAADTLTQHTDEDLLRAYLDRADRDAMGELFMRHADAAYRLARHFLPRSADAEDAVQTAFMDFLGQAAKFRPGSNVRVWLMGFVVNACKPQRRAEARRQVHEAAAARDRQTETARPPEPVQEAVRDALDALPEHYRVPIWLHYYEGLSANEVAETLSIAHETVRKQIVRGLEKLRTSLAASGHAVNAAVLPGLLAGMPAAAAPGALKTALTGLASGKILVAAAAAKGHAAGAAAKGGILGHSVLAGVAAVTLTVSGAVAWKMLPKSDPPAAQTAMPAPDDSPKAPVAGPDAPAAPAGVTYGWRGNWTGLFPTATPPVEFHRQPKGVTGGMCSQTDKPADPAKNSGKPLSKGLPTEWLVLGPIQATDVGQEFDKEQLPGEANLSPSEGAKAGELEWKRLNVDKGDGVNYECLRLIAKAEKNQIAYAHTYLWSERDGKAEVIAEHLHGLKVWVNGKPFYSSLNAVNSIGSMYGYSACKRDFTNPAAATFTVEIKKGWNRFLVKQCSTGRNEWQGLYFSPRLADAPREYDEKNIQWIAPLPEKTNASPVIVGEKIFTAAEPDELICLDKKTGKMLWRRTNTYFDAIPPEEVAANAVLKDQVAPLAAELNKTTDLAKIMELRNKMAKLLGEVDKARFTVKWDDHMAAHFGIVGFSTTPITDGKRIAVFSGDGVVACYDLDGNRKWIKQIPIDMYCYTSSPVIVSNNFIINCPGKGTVDKSGHAHAWLYAFDMDTGKEAWINKEALGGVASLIPAKIKGVDVVITQKGDVLRGSDGHILFSNPHKIPNDTGWAPAVVTGDTVVLPWGAFSLFLWDFSEVSGETWAPKESGIGGLSVNKKPDGGWIDRWVAAAPLIHENIAYIVDITGYFYAVDLKEKKLLYRQELPFEPYDNYNHLGVSASPTLGGKNIYVIDNQGVCVVLEPGPQYKLVARNVIATSRERDRWPLPREILSNGAPVFDGKCMYIRGHENMYCIGEK